MPSARRWWWGLFPSVVTLSALSGACSAHMTDYSSHVNDRMAARHAVDAPVPTPTGTSGGACGTTADCSHAGVCTDGKCECDMAWTGPSCEVLDLRPAKPTGGFNAAVAYGQCADARTCKSCVFALAALHHVYTACSADLRVDLWRPCSRSAASQSAPSNTLYLGGGRLPLDPSARPPAHSCTHTSTRSHTHERAHCHTSSGIGECGERGWSLAKATGCTTCSSMSCLGSAHGLCSRSRPACHTRTTIQCCLGQTRTSCTQLRPILRVRTWNQLSPLTSSFRSLVLLHLDLVLVHA